MTDSNTIGLPAAGALDPTDLFHFVQNVSTVPVDKKVPLSDITTYAIGLIDVATTSQGGTVSELATTAETITGTDASRVVTPAGLRGALDLVPNILLNDTGVHQISNTNTETNGNTYTIPAGFMAATGMITFECMGYYRNTSGGPIVQTTKLYFGGTSVTCFNWSLANGDSSKWWMKMMVKNLTASSQVYQIVWHSTNSNIANFTDTGTFAVNTANATIVKNTHQWASANSNAISDIYWGRIEYAPAI